MADKRRVKKSIKQLQRVKTWQLLILLLLAGLVSATFLRLNNIGMVERRTAVLAADEAGKIEDMQNRLYDLQRHVSQHMNTTTGRVPLEYQYQRDADKAKKDFERNAASSGSGANVYAKAASVCDPIGIAQGWRWPDPRYIACIDKELSKYPAGQEIATHLTLPDPSLYYHEFIGPAWSPDFAGWSLVLCGVISLMIIVRLISLGVLRMLLHRHYHHV